MKSTELKKGDIIRITATEGYDIVPVEVEVSYVDHDGDITLFDTYVDHLGEKHRVVLAYTDTWEFIRRPESETDKKTAADFGISAGSLNFTEGKSTIPSKSAIPLLDEVAPVKDVVNHPSHYNTGKLETIELIEEVTKGYEDGFVAYCIGNALKYVSRAPFKHETPQEDLEKAKKYLEFATDYLNEKEA